jgi:hypothetical protein
MTDPGRKQGAQKGSMRRAALAVASVCASALLFTALLALAGAALPPAAERLSYGALSRETAAAVIFCLTYFVVAIGKLPFPRLDRAGAALLGASQMVGVGVLTLEDAYRAIDFNTITLLLGMMIVVANLRLSGLFFASPAAGSCGARIIPLRCCSPLSSCRAPSRPFSSMTRFVSSCRRSCLI